MTYEITNHFDEEMIHIEKFEPDKILSVVYFEGSNEKYYVKRFTIDNDTSVNKKVDFIGDHPDNRMLSFSLDYKPRIEVTFDNKQLKNPVDPEVIDIEEFIGVKSEKAKGKRITHRPVEKVSFIEPHPYERPEKVEQEEQRDDVVENDESDPADDIKEEEVDTSKPTENSEHDEKPEKNKQAKGDKPKKDGPDSQMELEF
jgi:topoisomerase-4 subunit A